MRPITTHEVGLFLDAVLETRARLWRQFGELWGWPREDLGAEDALVDLGWHQKEFQLRRSFCYAVMTPDERRLLGCVYVNPPSAPGHDAEVRLWVRQSEAEKGLEARLEAAVRGWLASSWPFARVAWPASGTPAAR